MVGRISNRARAYVRRRATAVMEAQVRIERVRRPSFNSNDLTAAAGARYTLYEGPARLWEVTGQGVTQLGEDTISTQSTQLSIPWNAAVADPPRKDDQFVILSHHTDERMVGRRGTIVSAARAGDLRPTRRYTVNMAEPKGDHP